MDSDMITMSDAMDMFIRAYELCKEKGMVEKSNQRKMLAVTP
jgi:hypothetical protein